MKSGFVGLIGRPNVGKSTLMNAIVGRKVAITSNKPQTTRNMIQGIYHSDDTQIVFVDTPGIHKPNHKLGKYLNEQAYYTTQDVDIILMLVDASKDYGKGDQYILDRLKGLDKPVFLVINKVDQLKKEEVLEKILVYKDLYPFTEIVPVSALKEKNIETLLKVLRDYLPDEVPYYDKNTITNKPVDFILSEIIREKVFHCTEDEVPHSLTCQIDLIEYGKTSNRVTASIIVDRDSLKKIIIGSRGSKIKEIGSKARVEMEEVFGKKVYLNLFVKTVKKWRDREKYLSEFGFRDFE